MRQLFILAAGVALVACPTSAPAEDCTPAKFSTEITSLLSEEQFGALAFAFTPGPARVHLLEPRDCVNVREHTASGRARLYFFLGHNSSMAAARATFLAVQSLKYSSTIEYVVGEQVTVERKGEWYREDDGQRVTLAEMPDAETLFGLTPRQFRDTHATEQRRFPEEVLTEALRNRYWHGRPADAPVDSRDRLTYWDGFLPDGPSVLVHNQLIRFTTVPRGGSSAAYRRGIPFSVGWNEGISRIVVRVHSPVSNEINYEISFHF